ncbi:MAG: hypothetical protein SFT94_02230 [Pseudanabaenaceae cyanobacterium bins.68]|nr:hypothetical protein [Pseudanabaenaceae cyanobacterium bins.68]
MKEVKCKVLSTLSHDGNIYQIGAEAILPVEVADNLAGIGVVEISHPVAVKTAKVATTEVEPVVTEIAKKKNP